MVGGRLDEEDACALPPPRTLYKLLHHALTSYGAAAAGTPVPVALDRLRRAFKAAAAAAPADAVAARHRGAYVLAELRALHRLRVYRAIRQGDRPLSR